MKTFCSVPRFLLGAGLVMQFQVQTSLAQTNSPIPIGPRTIITNGQLTYFRFRSSTPKSPTEAPLGASPPDTTNFTAINSRDEQGQPTVLATPDTMGATGTNFLFTILNTEVRIQTRAGVSVKTAPLAEFWTSTNIPPFVNPNDPRILYDPFNDRWIVSCMTDFGSTNSSILVGVSRTSNPTNFSDAGWNLHQIKSGSEQSLHRRLSNSRLQQGLDRHPREYASYGP